jgi:2-polyprenyl-6-hydroxyphenyl methylase/3-demethylubiquinone-9 3-methyltransferase
MTQETTDKPRVAAPDDAFRFGRNWQTYVAEHLTPQRERIARESLQKLAGDDLTGRTFLDIGSGSGLFSLGAHSIGAERVVSVDVDPDSVASTRHLRERAGSPDSWTVLPGSVLDDEFVAGLDPADVVYSWGVLHHTGDMWKAIRNAAKPVKPGGRLVIAIYNKVEVNRVFTSRRWVGIKRFYNHAPRPVRAAMELGYRGQFAARKLLKGTSPRAFNRAYEAERGMAVRTDLIDWLGGYPYEYATCEEIVAFCEAELAMQTITVNRVPDNDFANNEFVFERPA